MGERETLDEQLRKEFYPIEGVNYHYPYLWLSDSLRMAEEAVEAANRLKDEVLLKAKRSIQHPIAIGIMGIGALAYTGSDMITKMNSPSPQEVQLQRKVTNLEGENQRLRDSVNILNEEIDSHEDRMKSFFILTKNMEAKPFSFNIEDYEPILERVPRLRPVAQKFLPIAQKMYDEGYEVLHPVYYLARFMIESSGESPWIRDEKGLRITEDKDLLDKAFTSPRAGIGYSQIIPSTAERMGLEYIEHGSYKKGFDLNPEVRQARRATRNADNIMDRIARGHSENREEALIRWANEYRERWKREEELESTRDSLFRFYEELVIDSIAGKLVSEVKEYEERMTPEAAAYASILHDHQSHLRHEGDPIKASSIYLSGSSNELRTYNSVYALKIRRKMNQFFGWLSNQDNLKFVWEVPTQPTKDSVLKTEDNSISTWNADAASNQR